MSQADLEGATGRVTEGETPRQQGVSARIIPDAPACCCHQAALPRAGRAPTRTPASASATPDDGAPRWLGRQEALPALGDEEGARLPAGLPPVVDAHVHLFAPRVGEAVFRWLETHAWPIRYRLPAPAAAEFLLSRGVARIVALHYAHRPGLARFLNAYVADLCRAEPRIVGLATVLPGEDGARAILEEGFAAGLAGVKLHCHVQNVAPDGAALREVYEACVRADKPVVIHAGREPRSPHYTCDPYLLCSVDRIERVLLDHPGLRLCVPHLGGDEFDGYERLLERFDNLWLDTTMMLSGFFRGPLPERLLRARPDRILYGTDFPNLPYAWDRELRALLALRLPEGDLAAMLGGNAAALYGFELA